MTTTPKRRRRGKDASFHCSLMLANRRLEVALKERAAAQKKLGELELEIPSLQKTIQVLQQALNPKSVLKGRHANVEHLSEAASAPSPIPEEISKYLGPQDFTGMGSTVGETKVQDPDDELLPEAEGTEIIR